MGGFKSAYRSVTFDGQSLNLLPGPLDGGYPATLMANYPTVAWNNAAKGATSMSGLALTAASRLLPHANAAVSTILILVDGQSDIATENDTGAALYAEEVSYANAARAAGFNVVIGTTIVPSTDYTAGQETNRTNHNTLLLNHATTDPGVFNAVVDLANVSGLNNAAGTDYSDGLHWSVAGCLKAANAVSPVLATYL